MILNHIKNNLAAKPLNMDNEGFGAVCSVLPVTPPKGRNFSGNNFSKNFPFISGLKNKVSKNKNMSQLSSDEEKLLNQIKLNPLPRHIAIIMDGNGRWAKKRGLPRIFGHREGTESVREMVRICGELKLEALTLFAFSTENWARSKSEVDALMQLLCFMLRREVSELDKKDVQLRAIGRISELSQKVQDELSNAIKKLAHNQGLILNLALNYGGRQEIIDAVNQILKSDIKRIDETNFSDFLYTKGLREPDLLIRTSGEQRISNFLLYQTAYSEFYTTPVFWPDFRKKDLYQAILSYQQRERRFGGTKGAKSKSL